VKKISICLIFTVIISCSTFIHGENISSDEWPVGKIEFIDKNRVEGILIQPVTDKKIFLNKNMLLFLKRGNIQVILKITDIDGKYVRCAVVDDNQSVGIKYSEDVFYSNQLNKNVKYSDARIIIATLIKLYENFILKIESTEDPRLLSEEVIAFSKSLEKLIPEIKRINRKYPELKKFNVSPPLELKNESEILRLLEPRLRDAFFKIKMYNSDEKVKKAADELHKVLKKMEN